MHLAIWQDAEGVRAARSTNLCRPFGACGVEARPDPGRCPGLSHCAPLGLKSAAVRRKGQLTRCVATAPGPQRRGARADSGARRTRTNEPRGPVPRAKRGEPRHACGRRGFSPRNGRRRRAKSRRGGRIWPWASAHGPPAKRRTSPEGTIGPRALVIVHAIGHAWGLLAGSDPTPGHVGLRVQVCTPYRRSSRLRPRHRRAAE